MNLAEITAAVLMVCVGAFLLSLIVGLCKDTFFSTDKKSGMRVIKKGKIPTKKVECLHCHSIIEYDTMKVEYEQVMDEYYPYIVCPVCNEQIMLGQEKGGKQ